MYPVAEHLEGRVRVVQDDGLVVVRNLTLWLGVDADHVTVVPHLLQQLGGGGVRQGKYGMRLSCGSTTTTTITTEQAVEQAVEQAGHRQASTNQSGKRIERKNHKIVHHTAHVRAQLRRGDKKP